MEAGLQILLDFEFLRFLLLNPLLRLCKYAIPEKQRD